MCVYQTRGCKTGEAKPELYTEIDKFMIILGNSTPQLHQLIN